MVVKYIFNEWLKRIKRLLCHLHCLDKSKNIFYLPSQHFWEWIIDLPFYIMDIIFVPEVYYLGMRLFKWKIRKLNPEELTLGKSIFHDSINYNLVRVDDNATFGIKRIAIAYVSFNVINFQKEIKKEIFIHELVHIWQYQHFGSVYIGRAIKAQKSLEGYDYGGVEKLYTIMMKGGSLLDFNFEQQADIIEDYFKIKKQKDSNTSMVLNVYQYFANHLFVQLSLK